MKYAIDETELARLEALAAHYANVVTLDNVSIPHQIIKSVPSLISEVRRLRKKVEAWEWFGECRSLIVWRGPEDEMMEIFNAAREAVHADRE